MPVIRWPRSSACSRSCRTSDRRAVARRVRSLNGGPQPLLHPVVVEQAQLDTVGCFGQQGEVRPHTVIAGSEWMRPTWPQLHRRKMGAPAPSPPSPSSQGPPHRPRTVQAPKPRESVKTTEGNLATAVDS
jgi:hypothetical protein